MKFLESPKQDMEDWAYSDQFSWIPTDFQLGDNGGPAKVLGYINNVHPKLQKNLISVIECLVGRFSLLWDKVLTDVHPSNNDDLPGREKVQAPYSWRDHPEYPEPEWEVRAELGVDEYNRRWGAWEENKIIVLPTVNELGYRKCGRDITSRETAYSIQGKQVQVIVKLANIHLVCHCLVHVV